MTYSDETTMNHKPDTIAKQAKDATTDAMSSVARSASDTASALGSRIAEGTEMLSEEARQRVIAARRAAISAGQSTQKTLRRGKQSAGDFFENQPLVVGALAVALGAAIGGLIPRSRFENETFGSRRDRLVQEADRILEEEKRKLGAVAQAAVGEARNIAASKRDAVSEVTGDRTLAATVLDEAKRVGKQVADTAAEAAKDEKLGKPRL